ncbi:Hypothetical protein PHPALM_3780 [Phytophthora palmivora]|uniref:SWIM-type domain-containing protein n=1 Tax=Phytophthora palmivora TaxID=4796 RepID=A0A2P4YLJ2_9STRA|nr:Hypothetical protein PHPALM_3780 [Phytophthora palmivora]
MNRERGEVGIAAQKHTKCTIYKRCISARCMASGSKCSCRYKIVQCESNGYGCVHIQGAHTILEPEIPSPREAQLTVEMKMFAETKLSEDATIFPYVLFSLICEKVKDNFFRGSPPTQEQVQPFVKR